MTDVTDVDVERRKEREGKKKGQELKKKHKEKGKMPVYPACRILSPVSRKKVREKQPSQS
jgi:hypothetical protein